MEFVGVRELRQNASQVVAKAAALSFDRELQAIVTYDKRMADVARKSGIPVESPC